MNTLNQSTTATEIEEEFDFVLMTEEEMKARDLAEGRNENGFLPHIIDCGTFLMIQH